MEDLVSRAMRLASKRPCLKVFLTGLSVEGFRGIGKKVSVPLRPRAGLTVITGRNGSGKSSLAESIELLLTGDNARWADKKKNSELRKGWRNLHHSGPTQIEVELLAVGMPMIALTRKLPFVQYLAALYIDPRFRGEGLGAELFAAVLADARERTGRPYVAWVVHPENTAMLKLSRAIGPEFATDPETG
jgi:GNAT superfamily N-acetyltransferase